MKASNKSTTGNNPNLSPATAEQAGIATQQNVHVFRSDSYDRKNPNGMVTARLDGKAINFSPRFITSIELGTFNSDVQVRADWTVHAPNSTEAWKKLTAQFKEIGENLPEDTELIASGTTLDM